MKIKIYKNPKDHESDNVRFIRYGKEAGYGYKVRETGEIGLTVCPKCDKENYAMNIALGICTWCGFNANEYETE